MSEIVADKPAVPSEERSSKLHLVGDIGHTVAQATTRAGQLYEFPTDSRPDSLPNDSITTTTPFQETLTFTIPETLTAFGETHVLNEHHKRMLINLFEKVGQKVLRKDLVHIPGSATRISGYHFEKFKEIIKFAEELRGKLHYVNNKNGSFWLLSEIPSQYLSYEVAEETTVVEALGHVGTTNSAHLVTASEEIEHQVEVTVEKRALKSAPALISKQVDLGVPKVPPIEVRTQYVAPTEETGKVLSDTDMEFFWRRTTSGADLSWQEKALCAQTDPESFYPEKGGSTREAKKVCLNCVVRAECLGYALENEEKFGIWGGLSDQERRRIKRHDPV